jgi:multiple sugar transport system ATP-binding protein
MAAINFEGVLKRYPDGFEAVKDLNLEIHDGEFMILPKAEIAAKVESVADITAGALARRGAPAAVRPGQRARALMAVDARAVR